MGVLRLLRRAYGPPRNDVWSAACNDVWGSRPRNDGGKMMAERQGFEPWIPEGIRALQARALGRTMRPLPNFL